MSSTLALTLIGTGIALIGSGFLSRGLVASTAAGTDPAHPALRRRLVVVQAVTGAGIVLVWVGLMAPLFPVAVLAVRR